jgi:hypothetical protein
MLVLVGVSFGLFLLHGVEIWTYAALYYTVGAIQSFEDALYFSTATYATIGYGENPCQGAGESSGRHRQLCSGRIRR